MDGTWDPQKFIITVGAVTVVGFAAGTFIKAEYDEDAYSKEIGADGRGARIRNANEAGSIEITLMKSSPSNDALSALAALDRKNGLGIVPCQVKDGTGAAVASMQNGWVTKVPGLERGKELGDVTWKIDTDKLQLTQGGVSAGNFGQG